MIRAGLHLLVVGLSLQVGFPVGWCCALAAAEFANEPEPVSTCCQHSSAPLSTSDESEPGAPDDQCRCCGQAVTISLKLALPDDDHSPVLWAGQELGGHFPIWVHSEALEQLAGSACGPPLHVLNCVWRC